MKAIKYAIAGVVVGVTFVVYAMGTPFFPAAMVFSFGAIGALLGVDRK